MTADMVLIVWIIVAHLTLPGGGPGSDVWSVTGNDYGFTTKAACEEMLKDLANKSSFECKHFNIYRLKKTGVAQ